MRRLCEGPPRGDANPAGRSSAGHSRARAAPVASSNRRLPPVPARSSREIRWITAPRGRRSKRGFEPVSLIDRHNGKLAVARHGIPPVPENRSAGRRLAVRQVMSQRGGSNRRHGGPPGPELSGTSFRQPESAKQGPMPSNPAGRADAARVLVPIEATPFGICCITRFAKESSSWGFCHRSEPAGPTSGGVILPRRGPILKVKRDFAPVGRIYSLTLCACGLQS